MNTILSEINEIPQRAEDFLRLSPPFTLPVGVPYLGMGSSYFAPLAFKFMGINIFPELASEYYNYTRPAEKMNMAVIISQSGQSSEALWCTELFKEYVSISNDSSSALSRNPKVARAVYLFAGKEEYSSSKTYINTLLALFKGFGFNSDYPVAQLKEKITEYEQLGRKMAAEIFSHITRRKIHGIYIIGSGPNISTAYEASLILSETTKLCFTGLPMAQYDHGPKETSPESIVIQIISKGKSFERAGRLTDTILKAGATVLTVEEPGAEENLSVLHNIIPFNYMAAYLAQMLNITTTFAVGDKVTTT